MPNHYLSVLYKHIIQVENKNVGLKVCVWGGGGGGGGGTNIPLRTNQKCTIFYEHMPPLPPPPPLPTPVVLCVCVCVLSLHTAALERMEGCKISCRQACIGLFLFDDLPDVVCLILVYYSSFFHYFSLSLFLSLSKYTNRIWHVNN